MDRLYVLFFTAYLVVVIHGFGGLRIVNMPPLIQPEEGTDMTVRCQVKYRDFEKPVSPCQAGTSLSWLWNGSTIASCRPAEVLEGFRFDDTSGELTILNVQRSMNGTRLTCRVVDEDAVETQMSTSLAVISAKFSILEVLERDEAVIECRAAAKHSNVCTSDGPGAKWSVGDSLIAWCSHQVTNLSGTIDNQTWALVIPNVPLSMNGTTFTCKMFGSGNDENTVEVIVRKRILVIETGLSEDVGVRWGDTTLKCLVNSVPKAFPRLKFKWLHDGISYDSCKTSGAEDSQKYEFHHDWKSCNLTIRHLDFADEGNYSCQVSESYITQSSHIFLTVNVDPDAVYILNSSSKDFLRGDVFIPTGTTHNFTCLATDTKPPAQIIWSFDGKDTSETTSVIGANLYNTSSALVVSSIQKGQRWNFTCTAIGLKKNASFTIRLIGQQRAVEPPQHIDTDSTSTVHTATTFQEPTGQAKSTLISIAIGVTALLLLAVIIGIVFWKKRKRDTLTEAHEPVVRFRRTESPRPTVPVSSALNTVVGASGNSGNIYVENDIFSACSHPPQTTMSSGVEARGHTNVRRFSPAHIGNSVTDISVRPRERRDVPGASSQQSSTVTLTTLCDQSQKVLIYADLHHTKTQSTPAPSIPARPPTQYADINQYLLSSAPREAPPFFIDDSSSVGEETQSVEDPEGNEKNAPPIPLRGNPIPPPERDWQYY